MYECVHACVYYPYVQFMVSHVQNTNMKFGKDGDPHAAKSSIRYETTALGYIHHAHSQSAGAFYQIARPLPPHHS